MFLAACEACITLRPTVIDSSGGRGRWQALSTRSSVLSLFSINLFDVIQLVKEGTFFIAGGGGWAGAWEGRVLNKFFTNWGGSNLFYSKPGEGHSYFGKEKITPCRFYFVYIQAKLPVKINLNYLQASKNLYIKKLSSPN